jgi:hypothetical protein
MSSLALGFFRSRLQLFSRNSAADTLEYKGLRAKQVSSLDELLGNLSSLMSLLKRSGNRRNYRVEIEALADLDGGSSLASPQIVRDCNSACSRALGMTKPWTQKTICLDRLDKVVNLLKTKSVGAERGWTTWSASLVRLDSLRFAFIFRRDNGARRGYEFSGKLKICRTTELPPLGITTNGVPHPILALCPMQDLICTRISLSSGA